MIAKTEITLPYYVRFLLFQKENSKEKEIENTVIRPKVFCISFFLEHEFYTIGH